MTVRKGMAIVLCFVLSLCSVTAFAAEAGAYKEPEANCSAVYVGKDISADGTTIIARCVDIHPRTTFVYLNIAEAGTQRERVSTGGNGFRYTLPEESYRYISVPWQPVLDKGSCWDASAANETGLAVTATVTGYVCPAALEADPYVEDGISEDNIAGIIAESCSSSREAVERIAGILDQQGSAESNVVFVADQEECWYLEIYTGHQYAAVRLPTDCVAGLGNEFMLSSLAGFDDVIASGDLESLPAEKGFAEYNDDGSLNLFDTYAGRGRLADYANLRTWRIHDLLAPSTAGEYETLHKYDLLYKPDHPVSTADVIHIFRDRLEGTEYGGRLDLGKTRVLATETASQVHVLKVHHDLPPEIAVECWFCFSNADYAPFIPVSNCLSRAPDPYTYVLSAYGFDENSASCLFKQLNALAAQDRVKYGLGIKALWREYERIWAAQYEDALSLAAESWERGDTEAAKEVLNGCAGGMLTQALEQLEMTTTDLMWYIMNDTDTLRYDFSYQTLELSGKPYVRKPFMPMVNAAEYAGMYGWSCEGYEDGILLTKEGAETAIMPSNGHLKSTGAVIVNGAEPKDIKAVERDGSIWIPLNTARAYFKPAPAWLEGFLDSISQSFA